MSDGPFEKQEPRFYEWRKEDQPAVEKAREKQNFKWLSKDMELHGTLSTEKKLEL